MRTPRTMVALMLLCATAIDAPAQRITQTASGQPEPLPALQWETGPKTKSVILAIGASLVLPGLGEYYAGTFSTSGKYALTADGVIWIAYTSVSLHASWVRNDARAFAEQRSGASFSGKDDQFAVNIGNYLSTAEYNAAMLQGRETRLLYTDAAFAWSWQSDADRRSYRDQRIRGDQINEISKFIVAAAVVNRVLSAFSAGRAAAAYNRAARASYSWDIRYVPELGLPRREGAVLSLRFAL